MLGFGGGLCRFNVFGILFGEDGDRGSSVVVGGLNTTVDGVAAELDFMNRVSEDMGNTVLDGKEETKTSGTEICSWMGVDGGLSEGRVNLDHPEKRDSNFDS